MDKRTVVAIDGPVGAGKSTVAKIVARELKIIYVDTGAMYRAVGLYAIRNGIATRDREKLSEIIKDLNIGVKITEEGQKIFLNGEDVTQIIRTPEISMAASDVSSIPEVRTRMVEIQREVGEKESIIMDGRDIGTVVLPDADVKIYLDADPKERAKRRYKELVKKGQKVTLHEVYEDLMLRDHNDMSREASPLKPAEDAIILDTTGKNLTQAVKAVIKIIKGAQI